MGGFGLSALFRTNPYERRLRESERILPNAGLARPLLMGEMGRATRQAEEFDEEKSATLGNLYEQEREQTRESALMKDADETFKTAAEVAKQDPIAATKLIQAKAARNKFLEPMKDFVFRRSLDGRSLLEVKDEKGQVRGVINTTDMLLEADKASQAKGGELVSEERSALMQKYFYPTPGYEKPKEGDEDKQPTVGTTRTGFRNRKGASYKFQERYMGGGKWETFGDEVPEHPSKDGEGEAGKVKSSDSKALKIEVARKFAPLAVRLAKKMGLPELQAIKDLEEVLKSKDPLSGDINPDRVYALLSKAGDGMGEDFAADFDRVYLDAETGFSKVGKVGQAVNDAFSSYHKRRKGAKPGGATPGGKPNAVPPGSKPIGTRNGKKVWQAPDGKRYVEE